MVEQCGREMSQALFDTLVAVLMKAVLSSSSSPGVGRLWKEEGRGGGGGKGQEGEIRAAAAATQKRVDHIRKLASLHIFGVPPRILHAQSNTHTQTTL